jgi:hypothetical protein
MHAAKAVVFMSETTGGICAGCSKRPFSKAAASEDRRRYPPHFVEPFARTIDLGERKSPSSASDL